VRGLGAKQIVHRLLSATPFFVLALAAVVAVPSAQGNRDIFWGANTFFRQSYNAAIGIAAILVYFALWWWSSLPTDTTRTKTQKALRAFHGRLCEIQIALVGADSTQDFDERAKDLESEYASLFEWIEENMDSGAIFNLYDPPRGKGSFPHSFQGVTDPTFYNRRQEILIQNSARIRALEALIQTDGWDK
jgi:hypothetical protein